MVQEINRCPNDEDGEGIKSVACEDVVLELTKWIKLDGEDFHHFLELKTGLGGNAANKELQDAKEECLNEMEATFYEESIRKLVHLYVASQKPLYGRSRPVV
ncbi:hypothetical protein AVEN_201969-1 [Araneus ventricosus]|uniref:Uncharacterized protein n=1 Tax=Araneus ventricosus TaxID=182803 RepID=A0A4Y2TB78_ARAVE|nr:hypothetical protein AVEN_201969-1 [Araneus ventricosus]